MKPRELAGMAFALATSAFTILVGGYDVGLGGHYLPFGIVAAIVGIASLAFNCRLIFKWGRLTEFRAYTARQPFVSGFRSALKLTRENVR